MSLFRLTVIGLGIVVVAITSIGASASSATGRATRQHRVAPDSATTVQRVSARDARHAGSPADSEWATAAHVAW